MQIDISISSATTKRVIVIAVVAGAVAAGSLASAVPKVWTDPPPTPGELLTPADLNRNFASLQKEIDDLKAQSGPVNIKGKLYSRDATYRESIVIATKGRITSPKATGYEAAKDLCQIQLGTLTAHMCTSEEVLRSQQLGVPMPKGHWFSSGVHSYDSSESKRANDCSGWTSDGTVVGPVLGPQEPGPAAPWKTGCDFAQPIMCCD